MRPPNMGWHHGTCRQDVYIMTAQCLEKSTPEMGSLHTLSNSRMCVVLSQIGAYECRYASCNYTGARMTESAVFGRKMIVSLYQLLWCCK